MAKGARKATDKRKKGLGNNISVHVSASGDGAGKRLADLFADRRKNNGHGKRAS